MSFACRSCGSATIEGEGCTKYRLTMEGQGTVLMADEKALAANFAQIAVCGFGKRANGFPSCGIGCPDVDDHAVFA